MGRKSHPSSSTISRPCYPTNAHFSFLLLNLLSHKRVLNCLTFHSYVIALIPAAAPDPAMPMKCPLPMLEANIEAPT